MSSVVPQCPVYCFCFVMLALWPVGFVASNPSFQCLLYFTSVSDEPMVAGSSHSAKFAIVSAECMLSSSW